MNGCTVIITVLQCLVSNKIISMKKFKIQGMFFFFDWALGIRSFIFTNPGGAQALGKEFPTSAPRLIQGTNPQFNALRSSLHSMSFEPKTLRSILKVSGCPTTEPTNWGSKYQACLNTSSTKHDFC